jgi:Ca2+/Na+ antiporter
MASRSIAYIILFIFFIASGISLTVLSFGNRDLSLGICIGSIVLNVLLLLGGALIVGSKRET